MNFLIMVMSVIGAWLAGAWAFAFWYVMQHGEMIFIEPNKPVLIVEFWLAVTLTVFFITILIIEWEEGEDKGTTC
uniref:Uncharacterized protein n=1 Tax=viral metagenome TaxID=1070528 RepID=A0A6M3L2P8_9ZZZZ